MDIMKQIERYRILPVVRFSDISEADGCFAALICAGLPIAEVTLRTDAGIAAIERYAEREDIAIGAGTVTTLFQCKRVAEAGARFVVSPFFDAGQFEYLRERGIPYFGGCVTPGEIAAASVWGAKIVKFFPAKEFGGARTLKSYAAVFPDVKFIPTGGINMRNIGEYLGLPNVLAVGGSFMVQDRNPECVERLTREALAVGSEESQT